MMRWVARVGAVAGVAVLSACATVPPEQRAATCAATDWRAYGSTDGELGVPTSERADYFQDCADLGSPVDLVAYQEGRAVGLEKFCTAEEGYDQGRSGKRNENVCPPALAAAFQQGYDRGREDRPNYVVYPSFGFGFGFGHYGFRPRFGLGVGIGHYGGCRYGPGRCW